MKKLFKSLRRRIIFCILLAGVLPILILHVVVVNTYESNLINERMAEVRQRYSMLATDLGASSDLTEALSEDMVTVLDWYSDAYGGRLMIVDRNDIIILDTYSVDVGKTCLSDVVFQAFSGKDYENYQENTKYLEFVLPIMKSRGTENSDIIGALIFSSATDWIQNGLDAVERGMWIIEVILFFVLVITAIYVSYLSVRPIQRVSYEADKMRHGHMSGSISDIHSYTEVDEIMAATSGIIENYRASESVREQFVSNVSHELRTPMASIRVLADSLIGQENIPEETYQEFLCDISGEIDRENHIIDDLLSISKLQNDAEENMNIQSVNINELVLGVLKTIRPLAEERKIEITYESFRQVQADIDEIKMNQVITNLVMNAVKYNNDEGAVKVSLDADHEYFYLKVWDNGIGIPKDAISHLFDRFYRVDKARSRETGGTGLGLSIAKRIILMHYGIIKVDSEEGQGATFTMRIPLKHVEHRKGGKKS